MIAGALHTLSQRSAGNYVRINCAAIPETLLESELFGHEKGAFTGALRQKPGRVEEADGGTIFLDEIGDMSRPLQAKLLRFLEDGTFTRVGGNQELRVDVRLIAATNRDIIDAIRQNYFREDLYHRLNVVQFRPPALRERPDDIPVLAEHFLKQFRVAMNKPIKAVSKIAQQLLVAHHWPGNVRELRNVVERAVILETTEEIQPTSLPDFHLETRLRKGEFASPLAGNSLEEALFNFERDLILSRRGGAAFLANQPSFAGELEGAKSFGTETGKSLADVTPLIAKSVALSAKMRLAPPPLTVSNDGPGPLIASESLTASWVPDRVMMSGLAS